jgi:hypothetical protein
MYRKNLYINKIMSSAIYIVEFVTFIILLGVVLVLYALSVFPFNQVYQPFDPRTWTHVQNINQWLTPSYDYSPFNRNIPEASIACVYCDPKFDPSRCIASATAFAATNHQPGAGC